MDLSPTYPYKLPHSNIDRDSQLSDSKSVHFCRFLMLIWPSPGPASTVGCSPLSISVKAGPTGPLPSLIRVTVRENGIAWLTSLPAFAYPVFIIFSVDHRLRYVLIYNIFCLPLVINSLSGTSSAILS